MQRYFAVEKKENKFILKDDDYYHIKVVMRLKPTEKVEVVYLKKVYLCYIDDNYEVELIKEIEVKELNIESTLILPLLKEQKMDLILQKSTELGVSKIMFFNAKRSIIKFDVITKKIERWTKICKEAAEQSKRNQIPHLYRVIDFNGLHDIEADVKMVAYEEEAGPTTSFNKIVESIKPEQSIAVLIGPEGGFSDHEILLATKQGFRKVSLGRRILRAETASFYALSVIANFLEKK